MGGCVQVYGNTMPLYISDLSIQVFVSDEGPGTNIHHIHFYKDFINSSDSVSTTSVNLNLPYTLRIASSSIKWA